MTDAADMSSWTKKQHRIAVDAKGYVWRVWDDTTMGMVPVTTGDSTEPLAYYVPETSVSCLATSPGGTAQCIRPVGHDTVHAGWFVGGYGEWPQQTCEHGKSEAHSLEPEYPDAVWCDGPVDVVGEPLKPTEQEIRMSGSTYDQHMTSGTGIERDDG